MRRAKFLASLRAAGKDPDALSIGDLGPIDQTKRWLPAWSRALPAAASFRDLEWGDEREAAPAEFR